MEYLMTITTEFDGAVMWTWMEGIYSWYDHERSHRITLAMSPQNISDMCDAWHMAFERFAWATEVFPVLLEEIGDMAFTERPAYIGGYECSN